jgi:hypothetical protein
MVTYPHCDQRILHAPHECEYCDHFPEWQELRVGWGICFTGHGPEGWASMPCPADAAVTAGTRGDHQRWPGNRPEGYALWGGA